MPTPQALRINSRILIPLREIHLSYTRSGGPGGQNVNKVSSKAVLRFNLRASPSIPEGARSRAMARLASRLTRNGELVLSSSKYRDQARNREVVLDRLRSLLSAATLTLRTRRPTVPSAAARDRRLTEKKARGRLKRERRKSAMSDEQ